MKAITKKVWEWLRLEVEIIRLWFRVQWLLFRCKAQQRKLRKVRKEWVDAPYLCDLCGKEEFDR